MSTADAVVQSITRAGPAFESAWARAPDAVSYKGAVFAKKSARTPEEKVWYTAAAAIQDPNAVARMSPLHRHFDPDGDRYYFLDADPSDLNAAKLAYARASAKAQAAKRVTDNLQRELTKWQKEEQRAGSTVDAGSILTLGIANGVGVLNARAHVADVRDKLEKAQADLVAAKGEQDAARAELRAAQGAYDAQNRAIRAQEQAAAQAAAQAAQQQAWAQQLAADQAMREQQAQAAQNTFWSPMNGDPSGAWAELYQDPSYQAGAYLPNDPYLSGGDAGHIPDGSYLDETDMEDFGDPIAALDALGEDAVGKQRHLSAWCFDRYYQGCDESYIDRMFSAARILEQPTANVLGEGLTEPGYGADSPMMSKPAVGGAAQQAASASQQFNDVGRTIGTILNAAGAIVSELAGRGPSPSEVSRSVAEQTGLSSLVGEKATDAGKAAGAEAGEKVAASVLPAALVVGGALLAGLAAIAVILAVK